MTLIDRPRNNLQLHLAWFHSNSPQIPRAETVQPVIVSGPLAAIAFNCPPAAAVQSGTTHPTMQTLKEDMKSATVPWTGRSEPKPKWKDVELVSIVPSTEKVTGGSNAGSLTKTQGVRRLRVMLSSRYVHPENNGTQFGPFNRND